MQDDVADIGFCTVFATLRCSIRETHLHVSSLGPGSTGWRSGRHHKDAAIADPAAIAIFVALSQSWVLEVKSENQIPENQWLASFNFPVFGSLRQSPLGGHEDSLF